MIHNNYEKRWNFTVKSDYHVAVKEEEGAAGGSPSQTSSWNREWSLDIPEKTNIFLWRTLTNLLPTACNLKNKKAVSTDCCQRCHKSQEDTLGMPFSTVDSPSTVGSNRCLGRWFRTLKAETCGTL